VTAPGAAAAAPMPRSGGERALWIYLGLGGTAVLGAAAVDAPANMLLGVLTVGLVIVSYQRVLLAWRTLFAAILLVIMFIPIRRYTVGGSLPIELEPYRIVIGVVLACWLCAVAADPSVRIRKTGLEWPIAAVLVVMLLSLMANIGRVNAASDIVIKQFSFFLSYLILVYFIVSVIRSRDKVDALVRLLVGGGAIVALLSLIEWRTGTNLFNWYGRVMPFLHYVDEGLPPVRGSGVRARGSAQHSIALSAALVVLIPLAVYLYRRDKRLIWLGCAGVLTLGALSTGSRTGTTMLIALLVSFLCIKPRDTVRLLPMLLPLMVVIQVVMPGTLGTMKSLLNPSYVIKEQSYDEGGGAGRVADLGPALARWSQQPFLGSGFGTKIADPNAQAGSDQQILDDQWLGSLLEIGAFGVLALLWLYIRAIRRLTRHARSDTSPEGWLAAGLAAALISFIVGMLTFDAFAFVQVTFLSFIVLALGSVITMPAEPEPGRPAASGSRAQRLRAAIAAP
jgi:O-antigen ligase/polysaccharide polymerase Wzy-like membrane protein